MVYPVIGGSSAEALAGRCVRGSASGPTHPAWSAASDARERSVLARTLRFEDVANKFGKGRFGSL